MNVVNLFKTKSQEFTKVSLFNPATCPPITDVEHNLKYKAKLSEIINRIYAAESMERIILDIKDDIVTLLDAEQIIIYTSENRNVICSKIKVGNEIREIRLPIDSHTVAGFSAYTRKVVNIRNNHDPVALQHAHPHLHCQSLDEKNSAMAQTILAAPILHDQQLKGVIQLINKKNGYFFTPEDETSLSEIAQTLGNAFQNFGRSEARSEHEKFLYLIANNLLSDKELAQASIKAMKEQKQLINILMDDFNISKDYILKALSEYYCCGFYQHEEGAIIPSFLLRGRNLDFFARLLCAPLSEEEALIRIVIDDPHNLNKTDLVTKYYGNNKTIKFLVGLPEDIVNLIETTQYYSREHIHTSEKNGDAYTVEHAEAEDIQAATHEIKESDSAIVRLANQIMREAFTKGASDIHIEPHPNNGHADIRIRIDGVCQKYLTVPGHYTRPLVSRFKIMSQLDITERRKPQDGKIKLAMLDRTIEFRVAVIPTQGGHEDVIIRILSINTVPLEQMGFSEKNVLQLKDLIQKPYGIFLCVGPTGSGKTTTLHSALKHINTTERKIWTAEDPVEITQSGLRQVQVQPKIGLTFASAMRAFLRADPDVIMVGEMRDRETASTGIEASLTGHLVLSTMHTNSASETVIRLLDMGMDPFNFADALLGILAQRLVRTLCKECKEPYHPEEKEFLALREAYGKAWWEKNLPHIIYHDKFMLYRPVGCSQCNNMGYKGRMGIHELLPATDEIKEVIQRKARVEEIRHLAMEQGMHTLLQDGIEKVLGGHTDFKQVRSVCIK